MIKLFPVYRALWGYWTGGPPRSQSSWVGGWWKSKKFHSLAEAEYEFRESAIDNEFAEEIQPGWRQLRDIGELE